MSYIIFFFFNDTATTEIYTLSLHDALPIFRIFDPSNRSFDLGSLGFDEETLQTFVKLLARPSGLILLTGPTGSGKTDRKSTRLNSSHSQISYAVFCLKKKISSNPCVLRPSV